MALILMLLSPHPSWSQEAVASGLKGPVHSVLTEDFGDENGESDKTLGSVYEIYDAQGYQSEIFRYKPDGSLWLHTTITRKGNRIFRSQTIGTGPSESYSVENVFDEKGRLIETDEYDGYGIPKKKTTWKFEDRTHSSTTRWIETNGNGNGTAKTGDVIETTDPESRITRQVSTVDGELKSDWVIQRDGSGVAQKDKIVFPDGSYSETEGRSDGSMVEDRYAASAKSHTYQKSDAQGHGIEVILKSDSGFIRCTYSFDQKGRPTGQINYDAVGKIVDKTTTEYVDDSLGNWIEMKVFLWDTKSGTANQKIVRTSRRFVSYY
jgi:hypothetical protein